MKQFSVISVTGYCNFGEKKVLAMKGLHHLKQPMGVGAGMGSGQDSFIYIHHAWMMMGTPSVDLGRWKNQDSLNIAERALNSSFKTPFDGGATATYFKWCFTKLYKSVNQSLADDLAHKVFENTVWRLSTGCCIFWEGRGCINPQAMMSYMGR